MTGCSDEDENDEISLGSDFFSQTVWDGEITFKSGGHKFTIGFLSDTTAAARITSTGTVLRMEYAMDDHLLTIKNTSIVEGEWLLTDYNENLDDLEFTDYFYGNDSVVMRLKKIY